MGKTKGFILNRKQYQNIRRMDSLSDDIMGGERLQIRF